MHSMYLSEALSRIDLMQKIIVEKKISSFYSCKIQNRCLSIQAMTQWIEINSEVAFSFFACLVFANYFLNSTKAQVISKVLVGILNSSKK